MILIITNRQDVTADFVVRELTRRGVRFARLNTDEFPLNGFAVARFRRDAVVNLIRWSNRPNPLDFREVRAVWYRRPVPPVVSSDVTDSGARQFAVDECYECLRGMWYRLECFWMSPPEAIRRAEHKLVQLDVALRCGFTIPKTTITNAPDEVRVLAEECPNGIVAKPLYLGYVKKDGEGAVIFTTRLNASHLADDQAIILAPAIYQQYIPKQVDIRVTVVGDRLFATKITATELPAEIPDWRYASPAELRHAPYDLPANEQTRCIDLVRQLGLEFGAIDYVLGDDGIHYFLEINANGQWAWLETTTGCPLSAAIADRLIAGSASGTATMHPVRDPQN